MMRGVRAGAADVGGGLARDDEWVMCGLRGLLCGCLGGKRQWWASLEEMEGQGAQATPQQEVSERVELLPVIPVVNQAADIGHTNFGWQPNASDLCDGLEELIDLANDNAHDNRRDPRLCDDGRDLGLDNSARGCGRDAILLNLCLESGWDHPGRGHPCGQAATCR